MTVHDTAQRLQTILDEGIFSKRKFRLKLFIRAIRSHPRSPEVQISLLRYLALSDFSTEEALKNLVTLLVRRGKMQVSDAITRVEQATNALGRTLLSFSVSGKGRESEEPQNDEIDFDDDGW